MEDVYTSGDPVVSGGQVVPPGIAPTAPSSGVNETVWSAQSAVANEPVAPDQMGSMGAPVSPPPPSQSTDPAPSTRTLPITPASGPQKSAVLPGAYKPMPEEVLLEWSAGSRPFKPRSRKFFTTVTLIALLIGLILFFANQLLPVAVVLAITFMVYVMYSIPANSVTNRLTTYGIRIEDKLYYWDELGRFWFSTKYDEVLLQVEVSRFPNRLTLLLGEMSQEDMRAILSEVLLYEKPALTPIEKAAEWLQEKIPLDLEQ